MTEPGPSKATDDDVSERLGRLPGLLGAAPALMERGRFLSVDCLIGTFAAPFHVSIRDGRIVAFDRGPILMRSWRLAFRATPEAFVEHWRVLPRPGWHDLLALTKRGAATLEGDLHPFMIHLQYFKDLLALPRQGAAA